MCDNPKSEHTLPNWLIHHRKMNLNELLFEIFAPLLTTQRLNLQIYTSYWIRCVPGLTESILQFGYCKEKKTILKKQ